MCHMVFYVIVVTFSMTLLMNKFTSTITNDWNLDKVHANHRNKVWHILHLIYFYKEILLRMFEIRVNNHLVSDKNRKIVNL